MSFEFESNNSAKIFPEFDSWMEMLNGAIGAYLGSLKPEEFLDKFDTKKHIDAIGWIFGNEEIDPGKPTLSFEDLWETIYPTIGVESVRNHLTKEFFRRIKSTCKPKDVRELTNFVVSRFGEILKELNRVVLNARRRDNTNDKTNENTRRRHENQNLHGRRRGSATCTDGTSDGSSDSDHENVRSQIEFRWNGGNGGGPDNETGGRDVRRPSTGYAKSKRRPPVSARSQG